MKIHTIRCRFIGVLTTFVWIIINFATLTQNLDSSDLYKNNSNGRSIAEYSAKMHNQYRWRFQQKCRELVRASGQILWVMPPFGPRPMPIYVSCKKLAKPSASGNEIARQGEFPHMVAIGWMLQNGSIRFYCSGSIISQRWILTAAHCTHGQLGAPKYVRLGSVRLNNNRTGGLMKIEKIVRHPAYKPPKLYADIALLELARQIRFGRNIKPACLYAEFEKTPPRAWVAGWGRTGYEDKVSNILVKVELELIDRARCSSLYESTVAAPDGIVPSMICAGDPESGWKKDTCQGDSGAPLQFLHPTGCLYQLVGVTSFGNPCGISEVPGVYIRISHFLDWIESVVWPGNHWPQNPYFFAPNKF